MQWFSQSRLLPLQIESHIYVRKKTNHVERLCLMSNDKSQFVSLCPVFISPDIEKTVVFYTEKLGFKSAKHYDKAENFATLYRDKIEFVIIQAKPGEITPSNQRNDPGNDDAYIVTATPEGVDPLYEEFKAQGVKILAEPHVTDYGSYEFAIEDIDGRRIGIGRIFDKTVYFKNSNLDV
jgi:catechol 2,3-dioxygenase-like lactoylglutathione lyase family enzyme